MKRVLTMTMNPCIDRTVYFSQFRMGETNYVDNVMEEAAGKGINVAVGLSHIGVPVKALGIAYLDNADCLYEKLKTEKIMYDFVELPGKMRTNQKLFDKSTKEMTECNERGCTVNEEAVAKLLSLLECELKESAILVLCGSIPPGVEADIYGKMIRMAKEAGVLTILDATGRALTEGIKEKPYLIKPNRDEFMAAFFAKEELAAILSEEERLKKIEEKALELTASGIAYVCISLGKDGMMLVSGEKAMKYPAMKAEVKSLQGAGDAMVAGLCKAIFEKEEKKMAEYALKMAASTISLEGSQMGSL